MFNANPGETSCSSKPTPIENWGSRPASELDRRTPGNFLTPKSFLTLIRQEATVLHEMGYDHKSIAQILRTTIKDARLLCPAVQEKPLKHSSSPEDRSMPNASLSRRAVNALLRGQHAAIGGRTLAQRARRLVDIAAAYTLDELMRESGVGPVTAVEVLRWLEARGRTMRAKA
jgi:hypothetical protein